MGSFFIQNFKKLVFKLMLVLSCFVLFFACVEAPHQSFAFADYNGGVQETLNPIKSLINWLFPSTESNKNEEGEQASTKVYIGGIPLGFTLNCEGVLVVATSDVLTHNGQESTFSTSSILPGDVLYSLNGIVLESAQAIEEIVNNKENINKPIKAKIKRKGMEHTILLYPKLDISTNKYKLGLFIRDNAAGVGTLTFVRADNNRFGALGHPVCDIDTGAILPIKSGQVFACDIVGVSKGERGKPGELKGLFLHGGAEIGSLDNNTPFGVFGNVQNLNLSRLGDSVPIASANEIKTGKAFIRCTTSGTKPTDYEIEIIKKSRASDKNNMVIRVIDKELLEKTGGIVQGMSGSPIIQNGKLVGAVTHVFVSDPTKGFGTFIENMIDS